MFRTLFLGGRLWRHPDFLKLWGGESVSLLGNAVTSLALPSVAILSLRSGPVVVGILLALTRLPYVLVSIPAGLIVDHFKKRPLMIMSDISRLVVLLSVPWALVNGVLSINWLYAVALLAGSFSALFDIAYAAYLPTLVARDDLLEGNAKLRMSFALSVVVGPSLAGILIQTTGAARAIVVDAASFIASAVMLILIQHREASGGEHGSAGRLKALLGGLIYVRQQAVLGGMLVLLACASLASHAIEGVTLPFLYSTLHLNPLQVGGVAAAGGVGGIAGAQLASTVIRRLGGGRAMLVSGVASGSAFLVMGLAAIVSAIFLLPLVFFIFGLADAVLGISQITLIQVLTPHGLLGRVNAVFRTALWTAWPLGNVLGGWLASQVGIPFVIIIGGGTAAAIMGLGLFSSLRGLDVPAASDPQGR